MLKKENHSKNLRLILLMWFVLFSLSPCIVKGALFHSVNTDYTKPLNKSKATTSVGSCSYSQNEYQQILVVKETKIYKLIEPIDIVDKPFFTILPTKVYSYHSDTSSGKSPPKYILYKRLKIDLA